MNLSRTVSPMIERRTSRSPRLAVLLGLVVVLAACADPVSVRERDLRVAESWWKEHKPASYDITIQPRCFCGFETSGPVVVSVRNGVVASRRYVQTGANVSPAYTSAYPSVDELYVILEDAVARRADRLEVFYEPTYAYPASVAIDYEINMADDEIFYTISSFTVQ
jgi:hypothetical protein